MPTAVQIFSLRDFLKTPHAEILHGKEGLSFFQSAAYPGLYENIAGHSFFWIAGVCSENRISACMLVHLSGNSGFAKFLTTKAIVWHGPVWFDTPDPALLSEMLEALRKQIPPNTLYIQFRNRDSDDACHAVFRQSGYRFADRLNLITPIHNKEAAWNALSQSRRREIRQSLANGLVVEPKPDETQIKAFYDILLDLYRTKIYKPLPPLEVFIRFANCVQAGKIPGVMVLCLFEGKVVGGMAAPMSPGNTLFEYYICGLDATLRPRNVFPSVMATWSAMEEGQRSGCRNFDFMGMGIPHRSYGVREFKARFGGNWINPGRWNRIHNLPLYLIAELAYNLFFFFRKWASNVRFR